MHKHFSFVLLVLMMACTACTTSEDGTDDTDAAKYTAMVAVPGAPGSAQGSTLALTSALEHALVAPGSSDPVRLLLKVTAAEDTVRTTRLPLNLALVIDRSGSMEGEKLEYVKKACELVIDNLDAQDRLSIVTYDSDVYMLRGSDAGALDKENAKNIVRQISSGSMTNLSGGMLKGFGEALKNRSDGYVHRVMLLSDGLANVGITDVGQLQHMVREKFQKDGIALSTFGVGADFNEDLMTALAEHGRGNYWFIDTPDKIPAIFQQELNGLLAVVAQNATITVDFPQDRFTVTQVFGAEHSSSDGRVTFQLNDLYSGEERNMLLVLRPRQGISSPAEMKADLRYDDVLGTGTSASEQRGVRLDNSSDKAAIAEAHNAEVTRRHVQFQANWNMEQAMREADLGNYAAAREMIGANETFMRGEFDAVAPDSAQMELFELNMGYDKRLETIEEVSEEERKMIQKSGKSSAYKNRKGK